MNLLSHLRMSHRLLAPYGRRRGGVRTLAFVFGNIRPDIMGGFLVLPHTPAARAALINKKIEKCMREMQDGVHGGIYTNYRLGIICHFLADFFCYAHNDWSDLSSRAHFRYEIKLNRQLKRSRFGTLDTTFPASEAQDIIARVWQVHGEYSALKPDPARDIAYTASICTYLLSSAHHMADSASRYP
ncbi:MAG: zinc dependent phospholipase C family protein, partial [Acetanaerobacterium sp.]